MKDIAEQERKAIIDCMVDFGMLGNNEFADDILKRLSELRKPSEDLVDAIEALFWEHSNSCLDDCIIRSCDFKDVSAEIANLAPFQVNAELLEALKGIERCCDNQNTSHENIWRIAYGAIQNAESSKQ